MRFSFRDRPVTANIISSAIYATLILGGSVVIAYLQHSYQAWFTWVLWTLISAALITVIVAAFEIWRRLPKPTTEVTPENIEANIRAWLDSFRLGVKREENPDALFTIIASLDNGMPILIWRPRLLDRYIMVEGHIRISPDDKAIFDSLPEEEKAVFAMRLSVELSRDSMGFVMNLAQTNDIVLQRRLPITTDLTESNFMTAVDEVTNATHRAFKTLSLMLHEMIKKHAAHNKPKKST
jgi:hypothetical protein